MRRIRTLSLLVARPRPVLAVSAKVPYVFAAQLSVISFCHGITSKSITMCRSRRVEELTNRALLNSAILRGKEIGQLDTSGFISISPFVVIMFSPLADNYRVKTRRSYTFGQGCVNSTGRPPEHNVAPGASLKLDLEWCYILAVHSKYSGFCNHCDRLKLGACPGQAALYAWFGRVNRLLLASTGSGANPRIL